MFLLLAKGALRSAFFLLLDEKQIYLKQILIIKFISLWKQLRNL